MKNPTHPPNLPQLLKDRRAQLGLSRRELAEQIGIVPETLLQWEFGRKSPNEVRRQMLTLTLGMGRGKNPVRTIYEARRLAFPAEGDESPDSRITAKAREAIDQIQDALDAVQNVTAQAQFPDRALGF